MAGQGRVIGRAVDLERVGLVLDSALAETPGTVLVLGEAGVGKTTILHASIEVATERGFATATGGCAEGVSGMSFAPFRAAFRTLDAVYGERVMSAAVDASPAASTLLPPGRRRAVTADASPDAGELYDAVVDLICALSAERPLLLALEDLHWADRSTLELLSFLARNLVGVRAVLFGTVRTEDLDATGPSGRTLSELARLRSTARIDLRGLDEIALRQLVESSGTSLGGAECAALHRRTNGNPFFALELVQAGSGTGGTAPLPPSITDVIELRLAALDERALTVVRAAAVLGAVDAPLLAGVLTCTEPEVESSLRAAVAAGVLTADPDSGSVTFRHELVREVAYANLLMSERRRLHQLVADVLGNVSGTDPAVLAHHYTAANRPADALRTSIAAARTAAGAYGSVDAVDHYVRAVQAWNVIPPADLPRDVQLDDLLQEAMLCALEVGTIDAGAELGSHLLDRLDPASDPERWALYAARQAELRWELGDTEGASALLDRAEKHLQGQTDGVARVRVLERRAFHAVVTGQGARGRELAMEALDIARRVDDPEAIVVALNRVALATTALGQREGQALLHQAYEEAWRARLPAETTRAAMNMLLLLHTGCRIDDVIQVGPLVLAAADDLAIGPSYRAAVTALYARALIDAGEWQRAEDLLTELPLPNGKRLRTYVAIARAELATARGDVELARRMLSEGRFDQIFVLELRRACLEAELALIENEPHVTRAVVDEVLPLAEFILDSSYARLSVLAMRSLARGDCDASATYLANAQRRAAVVCGADVGAPVEQPAWLATAAAIDASIRGEPSSGLWHEAAAKFDLARLVLRKAWAQTEEATAIVEEGADRTVASSLASEVHAFALRLGAEPLRRYVEALVRRARLDVPGIARLADGDLGLTTREAEVLRLVAEGRTNREIADLLYISAKTASVHVSNILRKVGATTRGEAAAIAHREGLMVSDGA